MGGSGDDVAAVAFTPAHPTSRIRACYLDDLISEHLNIAIQQSNNWLMILVFTGRYFRNSSYSFATPNHL
jgi:hypothetical protein